MNLDANAVAGMVFVLVLTVILGGVILMYPLTRRLGRLLEQRLEERAGGSAAGQRSATEVKELETAVAALQAEVARLAERQEFIEGAVGAVGAGERRKELAEP